MALTKITGSGVGLITGDIATSTAGTSNFRAGVNAGNSIASGGNYNVVVGDEAGTNLTTGDFNTLIGYLAGEDLVGGGNNVAVGYETMKNEDGHGKNTAVGTQALFTLNAGADAFNTAVGFQAGAAVTTGNNNTIIGGLAGDAVTDGTFNTFVGSNAGGALTTGDYNTFVGTGTISGTGNFGSGSLMTTGSKNTILGGYNGNQDSLDLRTASNNVVISDGDGNIILLYRSADNTTQMQYVYSNTTSTAANVAILSSGTIARSTSSRRYKNTINDATHGLTELLALRPVTFKGNNDGDTVFGGLIAEEVHDAGLTEFVQYNDDDEPDALAYGNMVSLCIKAMQEQNALIEALTARITALE